MGSGRAALESEARRREVENTLRNYRQYYVVYGADQPCNRFNNNTGTTEQPNCRDVTTRIAEPPGGFTVPPGDVGSGAAPWGLRQGVWSRKFHSLFQCCLWGYVVESHDDTLVYWKGVIAVMFCCGSSGLLGTQSTSTFQVGDSISNLTW